MSLRIRRGLAGLAALSVVLMLPGHAASQTVQWHEGMTEGLALAKKLHKPALISFYANWCGWCKHLDSDTYSNARVVELSQRFVMIRVNADNNRRAVVKYSIRSLPTTLIIDTSGRELNRIAGYRSASSFTDELEVALHQFQDGREGTPSARG